MNNNLNSYGDEILTEINTLKNDLNMKSDKMISSNKNIIDNARLSNKFNIVIPSTQLTAPNSPIYSFTADNRGDVAYSIALNYDLTNTQPNYSFLFTIDGVSIDEGTPNSNGYSLLPASGGYNPIPEGIGIKLSPNAKINIYAYNSGASATNGLFSISILCEVL